MSNVKNYFKRSHSGSENDLNLNGTWKIDGVAVTATAAQLNSLASFNVVSKSTSYTAEVTDDVILCDTTGGDITISLYAVASNTQPLVIKKADDSENTVTVDGNGSETIDESLTKIITGSYNSITLISNNINWSII